MTAQPIAATGGAATATPQLGTGLWNRTLIDGRAAKYVDKILKGAKPVDLPVQQATKFEFVVNFKAAKQIGLTIPARVLERANQVIK